jgi:hypothetical protein
MQHTCFSDIIIIIIITTTRVELVSPFCPKNSSHLLGVSASLLPVG